MKTKSGVLETPYLFPVVDPSLKKQPIKPNELKELGFAGIITNAYLVWKHYGDIRLRIHELLSFDGIVMTDSGAYQILQYGEVEVSNREIVEFQCRIHSDIGVILDIPTRYDATRDVAMYSVKTTLQRAYEVLDIVEACKSTLWVLPIQGGVYLDILREATVKSIQIPEYEIYGLGSPTTLLEQFMFDKIIDMIYVVRSIIPSSAPLHLFGAGHPLIIPFAVALGVDLMDSASYILYARDDRYMTRRGTYRLEELSYLPCSCPVCSKYTVEDLRSMPKNERVKLLALHNLYVLNRELREVKQAIRENRLWEYLEERASSHPAAKRALERLKRYVELLYRRSPIAYGSVKALFVLSFNSIYNPKVMVSRRRILERSPMMSNCVVFIPLVPWDKPVTRSKLFISLKSCYKEFNVCDVYAYYPILGVFPIYLSERYPFSQFESVYVFDRSAVEDLAYVALELLLKYADKYKDVHLKVFSCIENELNWSREFVSMLSELVKDERIRIDITMVNCI